MYYRTTDILPITKREISLGLNFRQKHTLLWVLKWFYKKWTLKHSTQGFQNQINLVWEVESIDVSGIEFLGQQKKAAPTSTWFSYAIIQQIITLRYNPNNSQ